MTTYGKHILCTKSPLDPLVNTINEGILLHLIHMSKWRMARHLGHIIHQKGVYCDQINWTICPKYDISFSSEVNASRRARVITKEQENHHFDLLYLLHLNFSFESWYGNSCDFPLLIQSLSMVKVVYGAKIPTIGPHKICKPSLNTSFIHRLYLSGIWQRLVVKNVHPGPHVMMRSEYVSKTTTTTPLWVH